MLVLILLACILTFLPQMRYFYLQDQQVIMLLVDKRQGDCPLGVCRLTKFEVDSLRNVLYETNSLVVNEAEGKIVSFQNIVENKLRKFVLYKFVEKEPKKLKFRGESIFCKNLLN